MEIVLTILLAGATPPDARRPNKNLSDRDIAAPSCWDRLSQAASWDRRLRTSQGIA